MAQPTAYTPATDFSDFQAANPTTPLSGANVDTEFGAIKTTTDEIRTNIALIQKDDGALANNSVGNDQLKSEVTIGLNPAVDWLTATAYAANDAVYQSDAIYRCLVAHTSGTFSTDLAASKWQVIVDFSDYVTLAETYLGAKSSDPTLDNNGDALIAGALYYNTGDTVLKYYTGSAWVALPSGSAVTTVAGISANVTTVAGISANVTTVAGISADVTTVAGVSANVTTVAGISADVTTVAGDTANIATVAGITADLGTVAAIDTEIGTVAGISANITTAATNVADITNFADVYIGAAASNPATRADTSALQAGDLYFNTGSNVMRVYNGATWADVAVTPGSFLQVSNDLSDLSSAATARTNLGLGTIATQSAAAVAITGGTIAGITDMAVADGGTGAGTAAGARTNLGAAALGANTFTGAQNLGGFSATDIGGTTFDTTDKGSVGSGTVTFTVSDDSKQKLTVTGALTIAFAGWPTTGNYAECEVELVNGSTNVTFPTINWVVGDGTTSTTFADTGITLASSGTNHIVVWSTDGGTTLYGVAS